MVSTVDHAAEVAERHLAAALPRRWRHVQAVAAKARMLGGLAAVDSEALLSAAWLHDIGYAPGIVETGFHSLDGARWMRRHGFSLRLAALVAHHSCASYEAAERGLGDFLAAEFPQEQSPTSDALWFADMTTGPDGQDLTVTERLAEIRERYGPEDLVTRFWRKAEAPLLEAVRRTEIRLAAQPM
ncbi:HD domain-containing protein [Micromonospora sp. 4G57]|uniref:HD domain-containing protein n=1 Tax=Micromonospora sicca TaxID=2202420 RepID=A0ABU5JPX2_9ACTN|nr:MULTISPECIES: HD domain-containing protein [unclassified Micromonospora]MDZ5447929.1 HD domain-containing protein [Micromonospora sp. 4G57]MDZ5494675.1 HD domain-containing protein [Micromonospora sp. 4G53]